MDNHEAECAARLDQAMGKDIERMNISAIKVLGHGGCDVWVHKVRPSAWKITPLDKTSTTS